MSSLFNQTMFYWSVAQSLQSSDLLHDQIFLFLASCDHPHVLSFLCFYSSISNMYLIYFLCLFNFLFCYCILFYFSFFLSFLYFLFLCSNFQTTRRGRRRTTAPAAVVERVRRAAQPNQANEERSDL